MLQAVKLALRVVTDAYDNEISALIASALADIGITGTYTYSETETAVITGTDAESLSDDPLVVQAIKTYVRMNFGSPSDYDRLKRSYDEQKAQLQTATGYGL